MRTRPFHELQRRWRRKIAARQSRQPVPRRRELPTGRESQLRADTSTNRT
jgi:hypothetical protein